MAARESGSPGSTDWFPSHPSSFPGPGFWAAKPATWAAPARPHRFSRNAVRKRQWDWRSLGHGPPQIFHISSPNDRPFAPPKVPRLMARNSAPRHLGYQTPVTNCKLPLTGCLLKGSRYEPATTTSARSIATGPPIQPLVAAVRYLADNPTFTR